MIILSPHLYLNMLELNACNYFILLHFVTLERCVVKQVLLLLFLRLSGAKRKSVRDMQRRDI